MPEAGGSRRVRALRPAALQAGRPPADPDRLRRPLAVLAEEERLPAGWFDRAGLDRVGVNRAGVDRAGFDRVGVHRAGVATVPVATLFLAGAECPFSCVFCDLWRHTLPIATPPGALAAQVDAGLAELAIDDPAGRHVKLYNASNFFDPRAVPPADAAAIADRLAAAARVVIECHPKLTGENTLAFADRLAGRLEVAMGLEVADEAVLARLEKGMVRGDFDRAAERLLAAGIGVRAFVLVGAPFVAPEAAVDEAVAAAAHALAAGAGQVALIPLRGGNGMMEQLAARGDWTPPALGDLEAALDRCLDLLEVATGEKIVTADLWELERFAACSACFAARRDRLAAVNRTGRRQPPVECARCRS